MRKPSCLVPMLCHHFGGFGFHEDEYGWWIRWPTKAEDEIFSLYYDIKERETFDVS